MFLSEQTQKLQQLSQIQNFAELPNIKEIYQQLIDTLTEHNHLYYIEGKPIISDSEYDQLFVFLKKIEEEYPHLISGNSPTQSLIGQIAEGFEKANHKIQLASLENSYNATDLFDFDERVRKILQKHGVNDYKYTIEPKYDGLSVEIIYQDGEFHQAITRGDGITGEDITTNVQTIKNLPKKLNNAPHLLSVRGEIMMPKSVWKDLNHQRELQGKEIFANTRNAAAWSIKLLDSGEVGKRKLICFIYEFLYAEDKQGNRIQCDIEEFNFPQIHLWKSPTNIQGIEEICLNPTVKTFLDNQDYDFDGLVIKVQNQNPTPEIENLFSQPNEHFERVSFREILGSTNHHPRRSIAYKFPAEQASTQILSIDFQVGRTGIITPVANLSPVKLSGAEISRVSLHNFDFIKTKEIKNHDFVRVQRSGEVIPYITGVIKDRRTGNEETIIPPLFCPSCQAPIINIDIHYYCTNPNCPSQVKEKIIHFVSKDCMDIIGIGESIIDILVDQNILHNVADIYKLEDIHMQILLKKFPGFGERKTSEISKQIHNSKDQPLRRIINALWIPHIGKKIAQDIANFLEEEKAESLPIIQTLLTNEEKLKEIYGIGEKTIISLQNFFSNPQTLEVLYQLQNYGLHFSATLPLKDKVLGSNPNSNKWTFSITGSFPYSREQIKEKLESEGYIFHENPTKSTDFILIGDKAGNKKKKAEDYWITIYEWQTEIENNFPILKTLENIPTPTKKENNNLQTSLF